MNLDDLKTSRFLKQGDVGAGVLVTIKSIEHANVAMEGADPDERAVIYFDELEKPLVLNSTNGQIIAKITGHEMEIEKKWVGTMIVLYTDPNVSYAGKIVGGIRVRAPKHGTMQVKQLPPARQPGEDDLPF